MIHQLSEQNVAVFLLQLFLLLGLARGLGYLFRCIGQPALVGEILAGVILGPTLLGRLAPALHQSIFPPEAVQHAMLNTVSWFGLLLLLLSAGLEVDVSTAWRQRTDAFKITLSDVILPTAIGVICGLLLPDRYLPNPELRLLFAFFVATVMTTSALPVTLKALLELDVLKSDLGLLTVSALTVNDIVGWVFFTVVLGFAAEARLDLGRIVLVLAATLLFAAFCVLVGRRWVAAGIARIQKGRGADAGMVLTFVCCVGLLAGFFTQWIGIHALFGLFLAGIMAGGAPALSERTRSVISQMVHAIFVPVFFASIALQIDFVANFDLLLVLVFAVIGVGARFFAAWIGARMTTLSRWDRVSIAVAHTPGGDMDLIMALVALHSGLITMPLFVAIVFSALASSVLVGPWLAWSIRRRQAINLIDVFLRRATRLNLAGPTRWDAIRELCRTVAEQENMPEADILFDAVKTREETAGTAIGQGMAIPHARLPQLTKSVVVFGRSLPGIDWNSADGLPARLVFLILTPPQEGGLQVQILAALARGLRDEAAREKLLAAQSEQDAWIVLREAFGQQGLARVPQH